jgi:uncharacterized protein
MFMLRANFSAPAQAEIPTRKISEIFAAANFVSTMSFVNPGAIGNLAICASAQYTLAALAAGAPIRSFVSVAGWYHDTVSVVQFYGSAVQCPRGKMRWRL